MKNYSILLILLGLICFQTIGYCAQAERQNISQKIYWGGSSPSAVAAQANRGNGVSSSSDGTPDSQVPMFNPLGAYGNMIQMMNPYNTYSGIEMQRQQVDYVKQQTSD